MGLQKSHQEGMISLSGPKTIAVSALQVEYPAPKNVVISIEFTTNTTAVFCVSLALVVYDKMIFITYMMIK